METGQQPWLAARRGDAGDAVDLSTLLLTLAGPGLTRLQARAKLRLPPLGRG